jgi:transposase
MTPFTVEGSCNRTVFEIWLETCLIPLLSPGQVVVMDNATFHKGGRIEQLIQEAGLSLLYLPAYSPEFNRIERCWSWLKRQSKSDSIVPTAILLKFHYTSFLTFQPGR